MLGILKKKQTPKQQNQKATKLKSIIILCHQEQETSTLKICYLLRVQ